MEKELIGRVTHYFTRICVAGILLERTLKAGDIIHLQGRHTHFVQRATSIQHNHHPVLRAEAGQEIGLLVDYRVRPGDQVYRLSGPGAERLVSQEEGDLKRLELER